MPDLVYCAEHDLPRLIIQSEATRTSNACAMPARSASLTGRDLSIPLLHFLSSFLPFFLSSFLPFSSLTRCPFRRGRASLRGRRGGRHLMGFERIGGQSICAWSGATADLAA